MLLVFALLVISACVGCRPSSEREGAAGSPTTSEWSGAWAESQAVNELSLGDPAPPLSIDHWVTGDPIPALLTGQIYVVEFWATWCPPCRASIPHLSQLQQQYRDSVQVIGVTREAEPIVSDFLTKLQTARETPTEVVNYRLATDETGATYAAYMEAAGQSGIPTAFIVGVDGKVEWIGHPMVLDDPLSQVVAGDWDREGAIAQSQQERRLQEISAELDDLMRCRQWDEALSRLDRLEAKWGRSSVTSEKRLSILHRAGRTEATSAVRAELVDLLWDNAPALNEIAWEIATEGGGHDLDLACKAARRASELREHQDAAILDTLARVYYERGELDEAIRWQKKAAEYNQGYPEIDETLDAYQSEKAAQSAASESHAPDEPPGDGDRT